MFTVSCLAPPTEFHPQTFLKEVIKFSSNHVLHRLRPFFLLQDPFHLILIIYHCFFKMSLMLTLCDLRLPSTSIQFIYLTNTK